MPRRKREKPWHRLSDAERLAWIEQRLVGYDEYSASDDVDTALDIQFASDSADLYLPWLLERVRGSLFSAR